jgi:hypothetical protein
MEYQRKSVLIIAQQLLKGILDDGYTDNQGILAHIVLAIEEELQGGDKGE